MYRKTAVICNETGLHARPASDFVRAANRFICDISIRNVTLDGQRTNGKSIILVLAQGISMGCTVEICAEGIDEIQAVDFLIALINSGFKP